MSLDHSGSERALRRVALGRRNLLFVHHADAGAHIAGLSSLVATCEAHGIDPFGSLTDVRARIQEHPASNLDDLLPGAWAKPSGFEVMCAPDLRRNQAHGHGAAEVSRLVERRATRKRFQVDTRDVKVLSV